MHNHVIRIAILVTRIAIILLFSLYAVLLGTVVYWQIEPSAFDQWTIAQPFHAGAANFNIQKGALVSGMTFNEIGVPMLYWLLIRTSVFFVLTWLILKRILKVLISVNDQRTFFTENINHFQRLAMLGILFALVSLFNFGTLDGQTIFHFAIPFEPLLFSLACWVLGEIFREGGKFREDSTSII